MGLTGRGTQALSLPSAAPRAQSQPELAERKPRCTGRPGHTGQDAVSISGAAGSTSAAFNFDAARQSMDQRDLQRSTRKRAAAAAVIIRALAVLES